MLHPADAQVSLVVRSLLVLSYMVKGSGQCKNSEAAKRIFNFNFSSFCIRKRSSSCFHQNHTGSVPLKYDQISNAGLSHCRVNKIERSKRV